MLCVGVVPGSAVLAVTASTRSTPESRSNAANSPVCASTATTIIGRSGQSWRGNRAATIARRCPAAAGPSMESLSNPNAPIARRRSAAEVAAAPMALIRSNTVAIGRDGGCSRLCPTGRTGSDSTEANSSAAGIPLRTHAAVVEPDEVPTTRSAASVRSRPASARPAMTPICHACPAAPPPPRTRATL